MVIDGAAVPHDSSEAKSERCLEPGQIERLPQGAGPVNSASLHDLAALTKLESRKRSIGEEQDSTFRHKQPRWEALVSDKSHHHANQSPFSALRPGATAETVTGTVSLRAATAPTSQEVVNNRQCLPAFDKNHHRDVATNSAVLGLGDLKPSAPVLAPALQTGRATLSNGVASAVAPSDPGKESQTTFPGNFDTNMVNSSFGDSASEDGELKGDRSGRSTRPTLAAFASEPMMASRPSSGRGGLPSRPSKLVPSGPDFPTTTLGTASGGQEAARSEHYAARDAVLPVVETGEEAYDRRRCFSLDSIVPERQLVPKSEPDRAADTVLPAAETGEQAFARRARFKFDSRERSPSLSASYQPAGLVSTMAEPAIIPEAVAARASLELQVASAFTSDFMDMTGCHNVQAMFAKMEYVMRYQLRGAYIDHAYIRFMPGVHDREIGMARDSHHAFAALAKVLTSAPSEGDIIMGSVLHLAPSSTAQVYPYAPTPAHMGTAFMARPSTALMANGHIVYTNTMLAPTAPRAMEALPLVHSVANAGRPENSKKTKNKQPAQKPNPPKPNANKEPLGAANKMHLRKPGATKEPLSNALATQNWRDLSDHGASAYGRRGPTYR